MPCEARRVAQCAELLVVSATAIQASCAPAAPPPRGAEVAAAVASHPPAPESVLPPIRLAPDETPALSLAVGDHTTCALLADESVWCWGSDPGRGTSDAWPRQMPIAHVSSIQGAGDRMYAVTSDGELYFWGRERAEATHVPSRLFDRGVAEVSVSRDRTCIRTTGGDVVCWWEGAFAQRWRAMPHAVQIGVGRTQACALDESSAMMCWREREAPQKRADGAFQIAVAGTVGCALLSDGQVRCWNDDGTAWQGPELSGVGAETLRAGANSICAWAHATSPRCIVLQNGRAPDEQPDAEMAGRFRNVSDLRLGPSHGCAVTNGAVTCWGDDVLEALGPEAPERTSPQAEPVRVRFGNMAVLREAATVAIGPMNHCLVTVRDELYCWGYNELGELGTGDDLPRAGPNRVPGLGPVSTVALGTYTTCALGKDHAIYCFGFIPGATQLDACPEWPGRSDPRCARSPVLIAIGMQAVAAGDSHVCMLAANGEVRCFGENTWGQLGNGGDASSAEPVPVLIGPRRPLSGIVAIRASENHTCALDRIGQVWCWGKNVPGSQGRPYKSPGTIRFASKPFELGRVTALLEQCVRLESGELRCWNDTDRYRPARVGICGTTLVAQGPGVCRVDSQGELTCGEQPDPLGREGANPINIRASTGPLRAVEARGRDICVVDSGGSVSCWSFDLDVVPVVGTTPGWMEEAPAVHACPVDPPERGIPSFPPEPFRRAYVRQYVSPDAPPGNSPPEVALSAAQTARLLALLNDRASFDRSMSACPAPDHEYVLKNAEGAIVARIAVGLEPVTLRETPRSPAHGWGDSVTEKAAEGLRRLCRELGVGSCSKRPCRED